MPTTLGLLVSSLIYPTYHIRLTGHTNAIEAQNTILLKPVRTHKAEVTWRNADSLLVDYKQ